MLTARNKILLAHADPWGLETGGCPGTGERWQAFGGYGLGAAGDVPIIGSEVETLGTSGEKISAGMEAGDINAVAEGMEEGLDAVASGAAKLEGAWNDAGKFFMSLGGTVTVPKIGFKVRENPAVTQRLPMWGAKVPPAVVAKIVAQGGTIDQTNVSTPQAFMDKVAAGWFFPGSNWAGFGLAKPEPGGFVGQIWNPFAGKWQASGQALPKVVIGPAGTAIADTQEAAPITAYQGDPTQRDVDKYGKDMAAYLALARMRVQAEQYAAAIQGHIYQGQMPWGLVPLAVILTHPQNAVMIAEQRQFSHGPFKGQTWRKKRIQWIKELAATIRQLPADLTDELGTAGAAGWGKLEAALAAATVDGGTTGTRVLDTDASGGAKGRIGGAAVAAAGAAGLGLLWMFFA